MDEESDAGVEAEEAEIVDGGAATDTGVEADESLSSEDSDEGTDTDWKAEFEKAAQERDNYKTALTQKRQLRKKPQEEIVEDAFDEGDEEEDRPVTLADLRKETAKRTIDSTLAAMVSDENKRKLVKLFYDTRIRQTGTSDEAIRADIQSAIDLADVKKLRKTVKEIARVDGQGSVIPASGSRSDTAPASKGHKFSAEQVKVLTETAKRLNSDPEKFISQAWKNQQGR